MQIFVENSNLYQPDIQSHQNKQDKDSIITAESLLFFLLTV